MKASAMACVCFIFINCMIGMSIVIATGQLLLSFFNFGYACYLGTRFRDS